MRTGLIQSYLKAVTQRDALNEGTMVEAETAGYWLHEASHDPLGEFDRMGFNDDFYNEVRKLIIAALNE